ncbi:hypothetical protein GQX73_g928 [Xylaria multiplex]|uniref:Uncharacterized protein n=1 Tax=Xylaria multiplex TaxID=323545 RepID=A0A7C8IUE9_9PEZI|nr:hypothetical protein GQX73_g928 [Xylaria multiplex]
MFLHSGASLHGHEFSKRVTPAVANPVNVRNPLLRSTLFPPTNRDPTLILEAPIPRDNDRVPDLKRPSTYRESAVQTQDNALVTSQEFRNDLMASPSDTMSGDETSIISDTDASTSVPQKRRSGVQKSTTYVLAHPPPKLRTKQRIIHVRPNLVLQVQLVTPGLRPRPTIDVYPSFAGARSIMAPLLKSVPGIAGIKRELSGQDILLIRSEDYASRVSRSESDCDEDGIMTRDLLAILSPSKTEDRAEIVMAEGMVWVATTRSSGNSYSYEFTSVDSIGRTITARWVRKQIVSTSLPGTPTSPNHNPAKPQLSDTKFTFSFLDPGCRRHPVLATLTSTSLNIPDTYTTVSQSPNRSPPTSQNFSPVNSPVDSDQSQTGRRTTQLVEEWQKAFISISAVWVALRHGWAPGFRPEDFMPFRTLPAFQTEGCLHGRRRSVSASAGSSPSSLYSEAIGRRKCSVGMRQQALHSTNDLPRRATSIGAAFVQKRRTMPRENNIQSAEGEHDRATKLSRRALSGDWNIGLPKGVRENSLAESMMGPIPKNDSGSHSPPVLAPTPIPVKRRAVSVYSPLSSLSPDLNNLDISRLNEAPADAAWKSAEQGDASEASSKSRHRKWKNMANWFRKLSAR